MREGIEGRSTSGPALPTHLRIRLSAMMFLQYAIWGAWLPLLWPFLSEHRQFSASEIGNMFAVGAIGALLAPFVAGQIADRWFNTEKFLAVSHLVGAALVWQMAELESYSAFLIVSIVYSIIYAPTIPLTNSLALHHLPDRDKHFSQVRVWGTIGWIVVGIGVGQWLLMSHTPDCGSELCSAEVIRHSHVSGMSDAFRLSAVLGAVMGITCLFLPKTPPARNTETNAFIDALKAVKARPLFVLFALALPISCIHQFYFVHTAGFLGNLDVAGGDSLNRIFGVGGGGLMTVGQMSEILVLSAIPALASRWSRKKFLTIGILAYALRMAAFVYADALPWPSVWTIIFGLSMHGICFSCFIFVGFMIVDEESPSEVKASAQSLFNMVIIGFGIIVGSKLAASVASWATEGETMNYPRLFSVPLWLSLICLAVLVLFYPNNRNGDASKKVSS